MIATQPPCLAIANDLAEQFPSMSQLSINETVYRELAGAIVEPETNTHFAQHDNWIDFSERWAAERIRKSKPLDTEALATAITKASTQPAITGMASTLATVCIRRLLDQGLPTATNKIAQG